MASSNKTPQITTKKQSKKIPSTIEDQNMFYAQFCSELSSIQEQTEPQSTPYSNQFRSFNRLMNNQFAQYFEQKINEQILQNQFNSCSPLCDDQINFEFPTENKPKFLSYIIENVMKQK